MDSRQPDSNQTRYKIPKETLETLHKVCEAGKGIRRNLAEINSDLEKSVYPFSSSFSQIKAQKICQMRPSLNFSPDIYRIIQTGSRKIVYSTFCPSHNIFDQRLFQLSNFFTHLLLILWSNRILESKEMIQSLANHLVRHLSMVSRILFITPTMTHKTYNDHIWLVLIPL